MKTALIIGGGFSGCAAAHQLALAGGWDVTIVEGAPFLGAGVRTQWFGGHPYTFGPRHFLTQNEQVFDYLNRLIPIRLCPEHEFYTYVERDDAFYNYPINVSDIERMPDRDEVRRQLRELKGVANAKNLEEYWLGSVGRILYEKMVQQYNIKMWNVKDCREIDDFNWSPKGVALKQGARAAWDTALSGYPYAPDGYNKYFDISTAEAKVLLSTRIEHYDTPNKTFVIKGEKRKFDLVVSSLSPDELFGQCYGVLPYMGRDFHKIVFPTEHVFPENVYFLYYANDEKFTRLVEYKKFTRHKAATSLVGMEIPSLNGKHYPMPFKAEMRKAEQYYREMPEGVYSIGRAGSYRYGLDIDDCIEQAMEMARELKEGGREHPVPLARWRKI
ncbi:MAG: FAD-dependent oxidoreductase [Candidatus Binataceae bacterium]|jgi:UDP-galactopyranose mutase